MDAQLKADIFLGGNIDDMINYIEALDGSEFGEWIADYFESQGDLRKLEASVKALIKRLIYDRYSPEKYKRTFNLLRSMTVSSGNTNGEPGLTVFSDPSVSPAKFGSPDQSYAVFFEKPEEFNTFIRPAGIAEEPINYRPFVSDLYQLVKEHSEKYGSKAITKAAKNLRPKTLTAKLSE